MQLPRLLRFVIFLNVVLYISGCAYPVYDRLSLSAAKLPTEGIQKNFGIPFYGAKPYLLVARSTNKDGKTEIASTIVSLPDKTQPFRARVKPGFGEASLQMNLTHGVFTSTTGSSKNTDTLSALVTAATGVAGVSAANQLTRAQARLADAQKLDLAGDDEAPATEFNAASTNTSVKKCGSRAVVASEWTEVVDEVAAIFESLSRNDELMNSDKEELKELNSIVNKWNDDMCKDASFNFANEKIKRDPIRAETEFYKRLAIHRNSGKSIATKALASQKAIGCAGGTTTSSSRICRQLNSATNKLEKVAKLLAAYEKPKTLANGVTLFEVLFNPDAGEFSGLSPCEIPIGTQDSPSVICNKE